jgi:HEAT repeat protein
LSAFVALIPRLAESGGPLIQCLRQLAEAESPAQLLGWEVAATSGIAKALRPLIETDTGQKGVGQTAEFLYKEIAIEALLCGGDPDTLHILETAIDKESNAYVCAEIMRSMAMLPLQDVPTRVDDVLLSEKGFVSRTDENERIVVYLASARVAASSGSILALKRLMHSNGLIDGHPLTVPVAGAVRQAVWLARQHRPQISELLIAGTAGPSPLTQIVSARALGLLMGNAPIEQARGPLNALAQNQSAMPYVRRAALVARAALKDEEPRGELRQLLVQSCEDPDASVRFAAVSALVDMRALGHERRVIEGYALDESAEGNDRHRALLFGQLAAAEPKRYAARAARLIRNADGDTAHAVLDGYQQLQEDGAPLAKNIENAIVARIRRDESEVNADPPMFAALAVLAPDRLLTEPWERVWRRWMPQSRSVFAELVPTAAARAPNRQNRADDLLHVLIGDPAFGVRRAASRSLGQLRPAALEVWCADAYASGSIHLRCLAMESASWLPIDSEQTLDNALIRVGLVDAERAVRDAAERSKVVMRRKAWARDLLFEIKAGAQDVERHMSAQYRLSTALVRVGDDDDLRELEAMASDVAYPPHVGYWLERTAEELSKQWKRTMEEWPEPWLQWEGAIERVRATVSAKGAHHTVDLHLWRRRAKGAEGFSGWGGAAPLSSGADMWQFAQAEDVISIQVENRKPARALVVGLNNKGIVLTGTGPYPSEPEK